MQTVLFQMDDLFCQIYTTAVYLVYDYYPWVSVLNSVDRLINLKYPTSFKCLKKFKYQVLMLTIIFIIMILIETPRFILVRYSFDDAFPCQINNTEIGFYMNLNHFFISNFIPFCIMLVSSSSIIHYFRTKRSRLMQNLQNYKKEKDFIKNIIFMDVWIIMLYTPLSIMRFIIYLFGVNSIDPNIWRLIFDVAVLLTIMETSCNFFIYYFCNKRFKKYFLSMFQCQCRNFTKHNNQNH